MVNFNFVSPTKIYFGKDSESNLLAILKNGPYKKILLVYGQCSIKKSGLYDKVINEIKASNCEYFELSNIKPNPELLKAIEGVKIAKNNNIDLILAVGGGSVIDTAKLIGVSYYYDGNPFDFNLHKVQPSKCLPIGVVLTISASGSELSDSCVITDCETKIKQGFNSDVIRPTFAILNPELTYSVSKYQTGCGIVDIISHSLERYFTKSGELEICDSLALSIIKETIKAGKITIDNPNNYDARAALMLLGAFSHNGLTSLGKNKQMPIHKMEHALSAYDSNIAHGAGLSILIPIWMEAAFSYDLLKFVRFSREIFNINENNDEKCARLGINLLKEFFHSIGMPISLKEVNIHKDDLEKIVDLMTDCGALVVGSSSIKPLNKEEIVDLLTANL